MKKARKNKHEAWEKLPKDRLEIKAAKCNEWLDAARLRVLDRHRSTKQTTTPWTLNGARSLGTPTHPSVAVFTQWSVICGGRWPDTWFEDSAAGVQKTNANFNDPSRMATHILFSGLGEKLRTPLASSRPLHHGSTGHLRGRHLPSLALPDTKRVDRGLRPCRDRRSSVARADLFMSVLSIYNEKNKQPSEQRQQIEHSLLLSSLTRRRFYPASFWTSRGHRCLPFSPPVRAFIFCRA